MMQSILTNRSLFSTGKLLRPWQLLDQWIHPLRLYKTIMLDGHPLDIYWTRRGQQACAQINGTLTVEMQLYFSCVVKKRVLFHQQASDSCTAITDKLSVCFNAVQASSCDPEEFARAYPAKRTLQSDGAMQMRPRSLNLDHKQGNWLGHFMI